ncbi:hypothetical protein [Nocardioides nanhaiensis]|uniref:DUF222 domain-containing protein n=1 Tax=Nocardioides nanhaiensis TaxID=1476871 RepID=A0ABP8WD34_9ACTN
MTATAAGSGPRRLAPTPTLTREAADLVLLALARAFDDAVAAALAGDVAGARAVLRTGRRRRARLGRATTIAGLGLPAGTSRQRRATTDRVLLAGDLQRLEVVLEQLARVVVAGDAADPDGDTRAALERLRACGVERLHHLATRPCGPSMTRDHHRCGQTLLGLLGAFDTPSPEPGDDEPLRRTAAALTATLLDASRHAARAALGDQVA